MGRVPPVWGSRTTTASISAKVDQPLGRFRQTGFGPKFSLCISAKVDQPLGSVPLRRGFEPKFSLCILVMVDQAVGSLPLRRGFESKLDLHLGHG